MAFDFHHFIIYILTRCRRSHYSAAYFLSSPSFQRVNILRTRTVSRNPLRVSANSMSVEAPQRNSSPFLDRKERDVLHFVKYHGLGNDFIMVDNRNSTEPRITPEQVVKLCGRNFGIGVEWKFTIHTGAGLIVPETQEDGQVRVDKGEPMLKASDVPTKIAANREQAVIKSELSVDEIIWNVTCVSMETLIVIHIEIKNKIFAN